MDNVALSELRNQLLSMLAPAKAGTSSKKIQHLPGLSQLLFIGKIGIFICRLAEGQIEFFSQGAEELLGYPEGTMTLPLLHKFVHPDDVSSVAMHENKMAAFFQSIQGEDCLNFKIGHDFRIRKANGDYIRVYKQSIPLNCKADGSVDKILVILTDISYIKSSTTCRMSVSGLNGQAVPADFMQASSKTAIQFSNLSNREKEVLRLIARNYNTAHIAKTLIISPHTVKAHRKNLLKKSKSKNSLELVMKAKENGWV